MDVAAVRPDELDPPADLASTGSAAPRLAIAPFVAVLVTLVLVAVLTVKLADRNHDADAQAGLDAVRSAVLTAASAEALDLTTIRYTSADADIGRIIAGATGSLRAQFTRERPQFPSVLARSKSTSDGTVLDTALVSLSGGNTAAQVIVAADAKVSTLTASGRRQSVLKHYRMVMHLQLVSGRWLVSDVAFAGAPQ